jgi:hypothetical protein
MSMMKERNNRVHPEIMRIMVQTVFSIFVYSLELKAPRPEIDQQSDLHAVRLEIIHRLSQVNILKAYDGEWNAPASRTR